MRFCLRVLSVALSLLLGTLLLWSCAKDEMEDLKDLLAEKNLEKKIKNSVKKVLDECNKTPDNIDFPKLIDEVVEGKQWVTEAIKDMKLEVLTEFLIQNIKKRVPELGNKYIEDIALCLLNVKARESEEYKSLYFKWKAYFKNYVNTTLNVS